MKHVTKLISICLVVLVLSHTPSHAETILKLQRVNVADQLVAGEILKVIYGRLNTAVEFIEYPPMRASLASSSGEVDGEVMRPEGLDKKYPTLEKITTPISMIEPTVFTKSLKFKVDGWESIKNYHIGIIFGVDTYEKGTRGMKNVSTPPNLEALVRMLETDRVDLMS